MTTEVVNLLADASYVQMNMTFTGKEITGTEDNIIVSAVGSIDEVNISEEDSSIAINIVPGDYHLQGAIAYAYSDGLLNLTDNYYFGVDSQIEKNLACIDGAGNLYCILNKTGNRHSIIAPLIDIADSGAIGFAIYGIIDTSTFEPIASGDIVANHPIIVDITANQDYFTSLGLTTNEEIRAYLDGIAYDDFLPPIQ